MTQVGIQFAKMLLARERSAEAETRKRYSLSKRGYSEIHVSLKDNIDALNNFPGIDRTVITLDSNEYGFTLISREYQRKVVLRLYDDKLYLGSTQEGGKEKTEEERLLAMILDERPIDSQTSCDEMYELFQLQWSDFGVELVSTNDDEWAHVTIDQIVSRAFGMAINSTISSLFAALEED